MTHPIRNYRQPFLVAISFIVWLVGIVWVPAQADETVVPKPLHITRITPRGENTPAVRQIVIQFNRPVVPIGRMARSAEEIPIEITPFLACSWRWINTSALACQLASDSTPALATRYRLTVKPGIVAEDGATLLDVISHEFVTWRPRVTRARFKTWESPGTPVIQVTFNQPVTQASVEESLALQMRDKEGKFRLLATADTQYRRLPVFIPFPSDPAGLLTNGGRKLPDDQARETDGEMARRVWVVTPTVELPLDKTVELRVASGLISSEGQERGDEERVVVIFDTYPEFRFLGVTCTSNAGKPVLIKPGFSDVTRKCSPLRGAGLAFNSPVISTEVKDNTRLSPDLRNGRTDYDPWANRAPRSRLSWPHVKGRHYQVSFPEALKAFQKYVLTSAAGPEGPKDEFGRGLAVPIDLAFFTDHRLPDYTLVHNTAVLEQGVDSRVPLYVTNLKAFSTSYRKFDDDGSSTGLRRTTELPSAVDVSYGMPLGVREMLAGKSGVVYGNIDTKPQLNRSHWQSTFFAQVTPYQVQVKLGHYNSLVWVTDFASGLPVRNARVKIYEDIIADLSGPGLDPVVAETDASGIAMLPGTLMLDPELRLFQWGCRGKSGGEARDHCPRWFVNVQKGDALAVVPLENRFEVNLHRASGGTVWPRPQSQFGHMRSWGTTAQGVYKAGEVIQYKIYVRDQDNDTFVPATRDGYQLEIVDPTGKLVDTQAVSLSDFGGFDGTYSVPETAPVGWYQFRLKADFTSTQWRPMRVLVSDFTPVPFKVTTTLNGDRFGPDAKVKVESRAVLHSGGPYGDAETRVTASLRGRPFRPKNPRAAGFHFDAQAHHRPNIVSNFVAGLDAEGSHIQGFRLTSELARGIVYGILAVESSVRDDRGRYVAAQTQAEYVAVDRFVGLRNTKWVYQEDKKAEIEYLVVDPSGAPVAGTDVDLEIERLEIKSARVKGAGNAYLTQFVRNWVEYSECKGASARSALICTFTPADPGSYRVTARIRDTNGAAHSTRLNVWVAGKGRVVWDQQRDEALEVLAEKAGYEVGDTARYMVKNPFPGAKALITIERYGILKQWVQTLSGSTPILEFPIGQNMVPGFYLSVSIMSPRVESPMPRLGGIDLGKPAFRTGYLRVPVADPYKRIDVSVETNGKVYKPRQKVRARIHAEPRHGENNEPIEIAVAVLDESVLDLIQGGEDYFDPYEGFYHLENLDVRNYSLLQRLVGRQNIERKGANPGGDGGAALAMRSLFKFVSYWNPSIVTDKDGNAEIEFEVPDNLTGWRIFAMAATPGDRMGLGQTGFKVNRPTEIRPVMPNQVSEGDQFSAGFSVMNRTDKARDIKVEIAGGGTVKAPVAHRETVRLEPYKRTIVYLPVVAGRVAVNRKTPAGNIEFTVSASDAIDTDAVAHSLVVHKRRSLETAANYASFVDDKATESLKFPEHIHGDAGEVDVVLSPSVIGNTEGAFRYMRDYPYYCWEQRLSKGVMAAHYTSLRAYLPEDLAWAEAAQLPTTMLDQAANFQAPNGGMTYFLASNSRVSPYLSAYTALAFSWLRDRGYPIPEVVEGKLLTYLRQLLRRDVVPDFYSRGMSSTVRAVALAALARSGKVDLDDLDRYRSHVEYMSLFGKAHFLQAATHIEGGREVAEYTTEMILQSAVQSAGKFSFNETLDDSYNRILATPLRANCATLSALSKAGQSGMDAGLLGDIPFKLTRTITQTRGNRDHWENTQENLFCMNALVDYARVYESVAPDIEVSVEMDAEAMGETQFASVRDESVTFSRQITPEDPGTNRTLRIERQGDGRLYYAARMHYAPKAEFAERVNAGIDIRKEYSVERDGVWQLLANPAQVKRGELVRVDIFLSLPTARNFLVVDDPVPGGLEPVNRDLANTSVVDANKGEFKAAGGSWWVQYEDWRGYGTSRWSFYHKELRHDSARFFSDYLPAGNYHLSYTAQAIANGSFAAMPVHTEEMYDPDIFGKGLPSTVEVK